MQIGFDIGATKIESVVLKDNGEETNRSRINCPKDYNLIVQTIKDSFDIRWLTAGKPYTILSTKINVKIIKR